MSRLQSLDDFWTEYLSEHRAAPSRVLHFLGTTFFFGTVAASVMSQPVVFPIAMAGAVGLAWWGAQRTEKERPAFLPLCLMVGLLVVGSPFWIPLGVGVAYGFAWVGHFYVEGNRPATFRYPIWSLLCDFRLWAEMVRGYHWTGDTVQQSRLPL
ncbi:MAG: DUF962 domain-containing protein [Myxococcales bacterium]|nr:DUF962 domain-containing protein [Myxococcales bacterium]